MKKILKFILAMIFKILIENHESEFTPVIIQDVTL